MVTVKRALLSCHDKRGLVDFARVLEKLGIELIASGGTAQALAQAGLPVRTVEAFAGLSEQLDGRVKTLHPKIHAGILARRDDPAHVAAVGAEGLIDLVVVNLYPFAQTAARASATAPEILEEIDIGGVALLRAGAKNFAHVAVLCQPDQYDEAREALRQGRGTVPDALARRWAAEALALTSAYDQAIARYLSRDRASAGGASAPGVSPGAALPELAVLRLARRQILRYGENPHQTGGWYTATDAAPSGLGTLRQVQGKELSFNNLLDLDAALRCLLEFEEPTGVVVKHASPCGLACADTAAEAYARAHAGDPEAAFGGVAGVNRPVDGSLARALTETFLEVVLAPALEPKTEALFARRPNLRVITLDWPQTGAAADALEWRHAAGGWLAQTPDRVTEPAEQMRVATRRPPAESEHRDLAFAWKAAAHVRSNGVVLARAGATVGIGQGQPSRVGCVRLAIDKAQGRARGAVAASDGFFPFPDSIELLAKAGVTAVVQPGGSIRDGEVIAAANAAGMAMWMTGVRHFRH